MHKRIPEGKTCVVMLGGFVTIWAQCILHSTVVEI